MATRRWLGLGLGALALIGLGGWAWTSRRPVELPPLETELPRFTELDPQLDRAPTSAAFGLEIGATTLTEAHAELRARGLACADTSVRAAVDKLREHKREQLAAADDPDAVSGASILYRRSKKESNPQVRLACDLSSVAAFAPGRPAEAGRALLVFDSPEHPLRHASLRRTHASPEAAMADLREAIARFTAQYGTPTQRRGTVAEPGEASAQPEPVRVQWRFADLFVEVSLTRFGRMISVDERIEVPWPVRADAPTLPR